MDDVEMHEILNDKTLVEKMKQVNENAKTT